MLFRSRSQTHPPPTRNAPPHPPPTQTHSQVPYPPPPRPLRLRTVPSRLPAPRPRRSPPPPVRPVPRYTPPFYEPLLSHPETDSSPFACRWTRSCPRCSAASVERLGVVSEVPAPPVRSPFSCFISLFQSRKNVGKMSEKPEKCRIS